MSQENVEIVRQFLEDRTAFLRGEATAETFGEHFDPQVEVCWHDKQTYPDTPQHLRGVSAVVAFSEQYRDGWLDVVTDPLELTEAPGGGASWLFVAKVPEAGKAGCRSSSTSSRSSRSEAEKCRR